MQYSFFQLSGMILLFAALPLSSGFSQVEITDSGGPIMPEQAAYDVSYYDLTLDVDPDNQRIEGYLEVRAKVVHPMAWLVMDLDTLLEIKVVAEGLNGNWENRPFYRSAGKTWIDLRRTRQHGEHLQVRISYGGHPRIAPRAPWDGGFSWAKTSSNEHWVATTCQGDGADLWWPCKDHVSDEPDSMDLHIRVPDPLVVASNGRLQSVEKNNGYATYHWFISNPINIYNVALNIAPYRTVEGEMDCVTGEKYPVVFYVLPEDYEKGKRLFQEMLDHLRFYEKLIGPYPFRADKYGVAQTPHLGMEHQTIIAYGAKFSNSSMTGRDWGFDALHHHELAHEWWGNLVTNYDWRDMWIHEGFGTYMQALYVEELSGAGAYRDFMAATRRFSNTLAVAPRETRSAAQIYRAPIYSKGAWILHSLRYVMGEKSFFKALRRMAYPDPNMEKITDGRQTRFVTTDDFLNICEAESGMELDWFFDLYLRQPKLPVLHSKIENGQWSLYWETPDNLPFPMPVEITAGNETTRIEIPKEGVTFPVKAKKPELDPYKWLLMEVK